MKMKNDRSAFYGIIGETIDIYQTEHAAAAAYTKLGGYSSGNRERCKVVVGHDAGPTADMMTSAVCAALCASGANVITLGQVPSGAVSFLTCAYEAIMGVMITGGGFDEEVTGLKFYQKDGRQVTGDLLNSILETIDGRVSLGSKNAGKIKHADPSIIGLYTKNLTEASGFTIFEKIKIAVDCADCACAPFAKSVFEQLGATVVLMDSSIDAADYHVHSFEKPSALINFVHDTGSDIGFAFSADGEMCIVALPDGGLLDSERLAEVFGKVYGKGFNSENASHVIMLSDNCHIALAPYIRSMGAEVQSVTGDYSYLAEEYAGFDNVIMAVDRLSGIVFPRRSYVPDGLLTAVMLLTSMNNMGMSVSEISDNIPKLLRNNSTVIIPSGAFIPVLRSTDLEEEVRVLRSFLSGDGRVLLYRPEANKVEIIVEGIKLDQINKVIERAEALVRKNIRVADDTPIFRKPAENTPNQDNSSRENREPFITYKKES